MVEVIVILVVAFVFGFVIYNMVKSKQSTPKSTGSGTSGGGGSSSGGTQNEEIVGGNHELKQNDELQKLE
jgi:hypothetical protein